MMNTKPAVRMVFCATALAALLGACGEKPQTANARASDTEAWNGAQRAYDAPGWKPGDKASWEEQIKQRNRHQNEYARIAP